MWKVKLKSFHLFLSEFNETCKMVVSIGKKVALNWTINEKYLHGTVTLYQKTHQGNSSEISKWQLINGQFT